MSTLVPRSTSSIHGLTALATVSVVASIVLFGPQPRLESSVERPKPVSIGAELSSRATLYWSESIGRTPGLVEVRQEGASGFYLSIPADWTLREIRNGQISAATSDPPALGLRRWKLPENATLSFSVEAPGDYLLQRSGTAPLLVNSKRINLQSGITEENSVLTTGRPVELP